MKQTYFDAVVIGAGAAGLFCGAQIGQAGHSVCVIDHMNRPAEKVRISGGGRCNFTNIHTRADRFLSENPHFAKSALARYTPSDFCDLLARHGITWHEKTLGQLFCDGKSTAVVTMLLDELSAGGGDLRLGLNVTNVSAGDDGFQIETGHGPMSARWLVIASGGLSIPKIGASAFAYDLAAKFGHRLVSTRPGLVPFTFTDGLKARFADLAGVSADATVSAGPARFEEALLFTHRGLSGPAVLQASSYWHPGEEITINLLARNASPLRSAKQDTPRTTLGAHLSTFLPSRLSGALVELMDLPGQTRLGDLPDQKLAGAETKLSSWALKPAGTEGWRTAEVTVGGVSTGDLSSKTMESRHVNGLFFIGECVDVTGWLGGYNFQWAWASAQAAATEIAGRITAN